MRTSSSLCLSMSCKLNRIAKLGRMQLILGVVLACYSYVWITANASETRSSTSLPFDGLWHYFCAAWSANDSAISLYTDGNADSFERIVVPRDSGSHASSHLTKGGCFTIGQLASRTDTNCTEPEPGYSFEGYLTDVSLWSKHLNVSEVCKL